MLVAVGLSSKLWTTAYYQNTVWTKNHFKEKIQCCYSATIHVNFLHHLCSHIIGPYGILCAHSVALVVGLQESLPLKVAPIQPSVTAAFHLQSWKDSDCQMWELLRLFFLTHKTNCKGSDLLLKDYVNSISCTVTVPSTDSCQIWFITDQGTIYTRATLKALINYPQLPGSVYRYRRLKLWNRRDREAVQGLPTKTIGILIKLVCTSGPNLVVLAWTNDELSYRQISTLKAAVNYCPPKLVGTITNFLF